MSSTTAQYISALLAMDPPWQRGEAMTRSHPNPVGLTSRHHLSRNAIRRHSSHLGRGEREEESELPGKIRGVATEICTRGLREPPGVDNCAYGRAHSVFTSGGSCSPPPLIPPRPSLARDTALQPLRAHLVEQGPLDGQPLPLLDSAADALGRSGRKTQDQVSTVPEGPGKLVM